MSGGLCVLENAGDSAASNPCVIIFSSPSKASPGPQGKAEPVNGAQTESKLRVQPTEPKRVVQLSFPMHAPLQLVSVSR